MRYNSSCARAEELPERPNSDKNIRSMTILGVKVHLINLHNTLSLLATWAKQQQPRTVFLRESASLMLASKSKPLRDLHDRASLVLADGTPLAWIGKLRGFAADIDRIAGADLLEAVCLHTEKTEYRHFFYGGKPDVAEQLVNTLKQKYPALKVAGFYSPPMREIKYPFVLDDDGLAEVEAIACANADFIWVGISSPKQEYWIMEAAPRIRKGIFFGIGAAFDFHAGTIRRAPPWMRDHGLEWLHRLASEPRRLWKRYFLLVPRFVAFVAFEQIRLASAKRLTKI